MKYGDNWFEGVMPGELKETLGDQLEGYYQWKLKTNGTGYAHIFFCGMKNQRELEEDWRKMIDGIAVYVQSEVPDLLERSNFYVWFFVKGAVKKELVKEIEDNTYCARKFVMSVNDAISVGEKLDIARKKIFTFDFVIPQSDYPMITGVEFDNFRVYKGKRTFDFCRGEEPARLIVLFAPNGMGKTSFFDGVEWGLSGSVGRFAQIADKNTGGITVLRNTEAEPDEPAYVKICQQGNNWVERRVSKINKQTKRDYGAGTVRWSEKNPLGEYFSDKKSGVWGNLILPHDKIDGFIAGMKPAALYKEWGGLWDADGEKRKQFEETFRRKQKETKQCEGIKDKYDEMQKEYDALKKSRDFVQRLAGDVKYFCELSGNTAIGEPDFSTISASGYMRWINLVDSQSDFYEKQIKAVEEKYAYLDREIKRDMETYRDLLAKGKDAASEQKRTEELLLWCRQKSRLQGQRKEQENEWEKLERELKEARFLYEKGEAWYQDAAQYPDAQKRREEIRKRLADQKERVSSLQREGERLALELAQREKERGEEKEYRLVCEHAEELAEIRKKQEALAVHKTDCDAQILKLGEQIRKSERGLQEMEERRIESFEKAEERCGKADMAAWEGADAELGRIRTTLSGLTEKHRNLEENLSRVMQQILAEEQTEERIKKMLAESRALIGECRLSCCPVCQTPFADVQDLLAHTYRITSGEGADRVREKQKLEAELSEVKHNAEEEISRYNLRLEELADWWLRQKREEYQERLGAKEREKENIEKEYAALQEREQEIKQQDQKNGIFVIYEEAGIASFRELWNAKLDKEIAEMGEAIEKNTRLMTDCEEQTAALQKSLEETDNLILRVEAQPVEDYALMREAESLIKAQTYAGLENRIQIQTIEFENLARRCWECNRQLDELQDISVFLETDYEKQRAQAQSRIEETEKKAAFVRKRMEEGLAAELPGDTERFAEDLEARVRERKQTLSKEKEEIGKCIEALGKLKYNKEAENYFRRWDEVSGQLERMKKAYEAAEKEKLDAEEHYRLAKQKIEHEMGCFLQRYRMGEIYEKLEPHEKLKRLVAEFSFDEKEQPGLSFGVVGEDGKTYPPAWFLSTAQLNVVAFAIFLGRALQTEEVPLKSIFIDDPIGHFDEMNIVGFVDLLRNIIENTDRQLIISTHEERVFGLIKRKMPKESYPAIYIDFREMRR